MFLDKHYSDFGGLDTRSNKLKQPSNTVRRGSKNFRYNFQDELTPANGFQHKSAAFASTSVGDIEYKYQDINTGESKSEILMVAQDGNLYRKNGHFLKFTNLGTYTSYSFYYDEVAATYKMVLNPGGTEINVSGSMTMDDLAVAITATSANAVVVNDAGTTVVGSTRLAYLIDVIISRELVLDERIKQAGSFDYSLVDYPSSSAGFPLVPFETTKDFYADENYEGISYINLNNVCYITDGGFPMKYDGYQVYRMGQPRVLKNVGLTLSEEASDENFSGFLLELSSIPLGLLTSGAYKYLYQYGFVDSNGAVTLGAIEGGEGEGYLQAADVVTPLNNTYNLNLTNAPFLSNVNFPVWSCKVDGYQNLTAAGGTITVDSGHNIKVGMLLRIPIRNAGSGLVDLENGFSYIMSYVSAVTSTSVTVDFGVDPDLSAPFLKVHPFNNYTLTYTGDITSGTNTILNVAPTLFSPAIAPVNVGDFIIDALFPFGTTITNVSGTTITTSQNATGTAVGAGFEVQDCPYLLADDCILQGGYASDIYKNTITDIIEGQSRHPQIHFGAFLRVYRTKVDSDVFYRLIDYPISWNGLNPDYKDQSLDLDLTIPFDANEGGELPRACKYLCEFQNQIVQAGRPVDPSIAEDSYPSKSIASVQPDNQWGEPLTTYFGYKISEAGLCDFQSWYWNDVNNPEGFPASGLNENLVASSLNDRIRGLGTNKDALFVFKYRTTAIITGTLAVGEIVQEIFEADIGVANHRTIQNCNGALIWLDPLDGFYSCVAGRLPVNIGYSIQDEFKNNPDRLDFSKSIAQNYERENLYICVVDAKMFLFDYTQTSNTEIRGSWYLWDSLSAISVLADADENFFLNDGSKIWKMKVTGTKYDYSNHTTAIDFRYLTAWLTYGVPTIDKHFVRVWINSIQGGFDLTVTQYGNYNESASIGDLSISFEAESSSKLAVKNYMKACQPKLSGFSVGFTNNTLQQYVRIQGFEIELDQEYDPMEPKL